MTNKEMLLAIIKAKKDKLHYLRQKHGVLVKMSQHTPVPDSDLVMLDIKCDSFEIEIKSLEVSIDDTVQID